MNSLVLPPLHVELPRPGWAERVGRWLGALGVHGGLAWVLWSGVGASLPLPEALTVRLLPLAPEVAKPQVVPAPPVPARKTAAVAPAPVATPTPILNSSPVAVTTAPSAVSVAAPVVAPSPVPVAAVAEPVVTPPQFAADYLHNPKPVYPVFSRRNLEEGRVVLRVRVSAQGTALEIDLKESSGFPRLDHAAREAVGQWKFVPARRGQEAVEAWVLVPLSFKLD